MSILAILVIGCLAWGCRVKLWGLRDDYLSMDTTQCLRGVLAVLVVCYHLSQNAVDGSLFHLFIFTGFLPVALFFFLTGFGLQKSYAAKPGYARRILTNRIPSVAVPYLIITALYWGLHCAKGDPMTVDQVLHTFAEGDPIASYSWYILFVLGLYLGYWVSIRCFPGKNGGILALNLALTVAAVLLFRALDFPGHWYTSCIVYPMGICWAMVEEKWLPWVKKHYYLLAGACFAGFAGLFLAVLKYGKGSSALWICWLCCLVFTALVLLVLMKLSFRSRLLRLLGSCSMEIYLLHGFFMQLYAGAAPAWLWCGGVLVSTVAGGWVLHQLFRKIPIGKQGAKA